MKLLLRVSAVLAAAAIATPAMACGLKHTTADAKEDPATVAQNQTVQKADEARAQPQQDRKAQPDRRKADDKAGQVAQK